MLIRARGKLYATAVVLLLALLCACETGCVRRRMTIRSNPPGALVKVDDTEIGYTPVSTPFTYYGTRQIRLEKDGFETITVKQTFRPKWYEIPPLDFFAENLWPYELRDERALDFQLYQQQIVPDGVLTERAEQLRSSARQGYVVPMPSSAPTDATWPSLPPSGGPSPLPAPGM